MSKVLSIVIPVFNKYMFTRSCLADLSKLPSDHEIIVVDNGSSDETQAQLEGSKEIIYWRNKENCGFAPASNRGYSMATALNVLFMNNDIRVKSNHTGWTQELIKWCPYSLVGPTMGLLDDNLNFVKEANTLLTGKSYMSGWCLASSKEIWDRLAIRREPSAVIYDQTPPLQIFSEEYFCYFEDTDLSFRARQLSIMMQVVDIPLVHFGKQSSSQLNTHLLYKQARQIFVKKWSKLNCQRDPK